VSLSVPAFLREHQEEILRAWDEAVHRDSRGGGVPTAMRERLPALIDELAAWLETEPEAAAFEIAPSGSSPDLRQFVAAVGTLREAILCLLLGAENGAQSRAIEAGALARLNAGLDRAIASAVERHHTALCSEERRSDARYRALFDAIDEGVCIVEVLLGKGGMPVDYRFVEVNPAFERHTGLVGAVGRRMRDLEPEHEEHWFQIYGKVALTGVPVRFENDAKALGRWFDVYAVRVGDPAARQVAILFKDLTARKAAEEALRDSEQRYRLLNDELRETDRRKNDFLGMLSHELRNPLGPIRNSLYLLERSDPAGVQAQRARAVLDRQVEHLTRLVDDLLDVTRISRGKVEIARAPLDLREVVRRTCDDYRSLFEGAGVELSLSFSPTPICAEVDATRMAQVAGNLLQNAVKFTPGGRRVEVSVGTQEGQAELAVRDEGIGIDPAELERMFEPFVQAEQTLARTHGGLGLGLALVKGVVELHGGSVRAFSEGSGRGSTFVIRLPLATRDAAVAGGERAGPRRDRARKVLIIEDNPDAGETLLEILEMSGHRVRLARDGNSGIALAQELEPDVVLCDIGLPDVSGYEVARALRTIDKLRSTRLIALTGYTQPGDKRRAQEAGFDAHLSKPPPLETLQEMLEASGT
jgi:signal transduction histidine kinase/CheY-like chemotaxis protein